MKQAFPAAYDSTIAFLQALHGVLLSLRRRFDSHGHILAERGLLFAVVLLQVWVFLVVPTDMNGDPNDYLATARTIFSGQAAYSLHHFLGFPLVIKVISFNLRHLNYLFAFQASLFVVSLVFCSRSPGLLPMGRYLVYLPGLVPATAYMQKLIFPDGLLLSLVLILMGLVARRHWAGAAVTSCLLAGVKVVFIFAPILLLAYWMVARHYIGVRLAVLAFGAFIGLLPPAVLFFKPIALYMPIVQVPDFVSRDTASAYIPGRLEVDCAGVRTEITDPQILARIPEYSWDEYSVPLGRNASALGCSVRDMRDIQRRLVFHYFARAPLGTVDKLLGNSVRALFGIPQTDHLGYMLHQKNGLLKGGGGMTADTSARASCAIFAFNAWNR